MPGLKEEAIVCVRPITCDDPAAALRLSVLKRFRVRLQSHFAGIHRNSWLTDASKRADTVLRQIEALGSGPVLLSGDLVDDRKDDFQMSTPF
jgi:hypothetical protein